MDWKEGTADSCITEREAPRLAIVCPCYNEEATLGESLERLMDHLTQMSGEGLCLGDSFVLISDDGSRDSSWRIIEEWHRRYPERVHGIRLARNAGHQNAIMAGMTEAVGLGAEAVVTMDVDLQDDLLAVSDMLRSWREGYDVVYGVKVSREADPPLKRFTAKAFYRLQQRMGIEIVYNHADFRLLSSRVVRELSRYEERNLYLRGIIPHIGYPSTTVDDHLQPRRAGVSKYTFGKSLRLALDGITSFSVKPLYLTMALGGIYILVAIGIGIYVLASLLSGNAEHGWSSMMLSIWFVGGTTLIALGILGFYVGKTYIEVKHRPLYHIDRKI